MEFPSCLHLAKGHLHNCSVPSSWANLQSCAWECWNTKPLKQKLKLSVASFIFSVLCKHTCECFACLNQVYCAWNYASNWKSNMLKSIYNTAQSYSISTSRQEPFPTTLRVCQIFCPSKTLKAAHYLSTALQLRTAPNISFPQPSLLLKASQPHTRVLLSARRQEQNKTRVFLQQVRAALCTLHLHRSNRRRQTSGAPHFGRN